MAGPPLHFHSNIHVVNGPLLPRLHTTAIHGMCPRVYKTYLRYRLSRIWSQSLTLNLYLPDMPCTGYIGHIVWGQGNVWDWMWLGHLIHYWAPGILHMPDWGFVDVFRDCSLPIGESVFSWTRWWKDIWSLCRGPSFTDLMTHFLAGRDMDRIWEFLSLAAVMNSQHRRWSQYWDKEAIIQYLG